MRTQGFWFVPGAIAISALLIRAGVTAESDMGHAGHAPEAAPAQNSVRITMKRLHELPGGVPRGWKFAVPPGDVAAGREAFVKFECFKCHAVEGEKFPAANKTAENVGPDLTGMGAHHPAEFLAQSVMDPNAVILTDKGFTGPDGKSRMPDYTSSMTVRELIDVVAYLKSLKGGQMHMDMPSSSQGAAPSKAMKGMPGMSMPESKGH